MMTGLVLTTYTLITSLFRVSAVEAVVLSEVFPNPDGDEKVGEWIEVYNHTSDPINVGGFVIKDTTDRFWKFPDTTLTPESYLVIERSNQSMSLNNDGDSISLFESSSSTTPRDSMSYSKTVENKSWSRVGEEWILTTASPNAPNPVPTPTPRPTPSPSASPKPSPTPKPVASTQSSATPVKVVSAPTKSWQPTDYPGEIEGIMDTLESSEPATSSGAYKPRLPLQLSPDFEEKEASSEILLDYTHPPSRAGSWLMLAGGSFLAVSLGKIIRLWQLHRID